MRERTNLFERMILFAPQVLHRQAISAKPHVKDEGELEDVFVWSISYFEQLDAYTPPPKLHHPSPTPQTPNILLGPYSRIKPRAIRQG